MCFYFLSSSFSLYYFYPIKKRKNSYLTNCLKLNCTNIIPLNHFAKTGELLRQHGHLLVLHCLIHSKLKHPSVQFCSQRSQSPLQASIDLVASDTWFTTRIISNIIIITVIPFFISLAAIALLNVCISSTSISIKFMKIYMFQVWHWKNIFTWPYL